MAQTHSSDSRRKRGFTLIEVVIGVMVLTLVLLPLFSVLKSGFRLVKDARIDTVASQILQSEMENIRAQNYAQVQTNYVSKSQPVNLGSSIQSEGFNKTPTTFNLTGNFQVVDASAPGHYGMTTVYLTISWKNDSGQTRSLSYYTCLSDKGLSDYVVQGF